MMLLIDIGPGDVLGSNDKSDDGVPAGMIYLVIGIVITYNVYNR